MVVRLAIMPGITVVQTVHLVTIAGMVIRAAIIPRSVDREVPARLIQARVVAFAAVAVASAVAVFVAVVAVAAWAAEDSRELISENCEH